MSMDKYPTIFLRQMEAIVYIDEVHVEHIILLQSWGLIFSAPGS